MNDEIFAGAEALTFDDLLVVPGWSEVLPSEVDTTTSLAGIELRVPLMSAAMDTVTEAPLAIAIARAGGLGVLHRNFSIEEQADEVDRVKRAQAGMISSPISLPPTATLHDAEALMRRHKISGVPICDPDGHLVGTINVEGGDSFSTYLGWIIPWGTPITLLGDSADDVAEAQRQLVRIGIDRPAGSALTDAVRDDHAGSYRVARFDDLRAAREDGATCSVLDTRLAGEWAEAHVPGALHIPLHELLQRMGEVPDGPVWVYCASGYRASIASSLLARAGKNVVLIDEDVSAARPLMLATA